jgi:hypothetical protein
LSVVLALGLEDALDLVGVVEIVLDRRLAAPDDEDEMLDPGGAGFLDDVRQDRPVEHVQHVLRRGLGGGQDARPETGDRKHGLAHARRSRRHQLPARECSDSRTIIGQFALPAKVRPPS